MNREGMCQIIFDISSDVYLFRVSKGGKETFPHVIISSAGNGGTKGIRIRMGHGNGANPGFLDEDDISSTGLKVGMSQRTLLVHIN